MTKGEPQRRPSQRCHSEAHGIATMYSLSDYVREGQYIFTFYLRAEIIFAQPVGRAIYTTVTTVAGSSAMRAERLNGFSSPGAGVTTPDAGACTVCSRILWYSSNITPQR